MEKYYVVAFDHGQGEFSYWLSLTRELPAGCIILNGSTRLEYRHARDFVDTMLTMKD